MAFFINFNLMQKNEINTLSKFNNHKKIIILKNNC